MKKDQFLRAFVALVLASSLPVIAVSAFADPSQHQAKIPLVDARARALAIVPGAVRAEELEHEGGRWIYSFEIKPTGETRNLIKEVNIDADTGAIVSVETERGR